jgi:DNA repair protein RecO (recombination protein O)
MPTYQADAIVLRRLDYGEADRILTLLTREYGKLAVIAKGARKSKTRSHSAMDLFSRSRMLIAKGHNLDVVAQVERRGDARHISGDLWRTAYACLVADVVDKVLEERHPVDEVYDLVVQTLDHLNVPERSCRADAAWFAMRMLDQLGYLPQLLDCAGCGTPLPEAAAWFSPTYGGVLCPACPSPLVAGDSPSPLWGGQGRGYQVSVNTLKILRLMAAGDSELYDRIRLTDGLLEEIEDVLYAQLEYHLDRRLKSIEFLRELRSRPAALPVEA